jgi:PAS domain S-box-containing protein/putative nucleotidyltransferase with HDIG domain
MPGNRGYSMNNRTVIAIDYGAVPDSALDMRSADVDDRYRQILMRMPAPIFEFASNGDIIFMNEAITRATGYTSNELAGIQWLFKLFQGEQRRQIARLYRRVLTGNITDYELAMTNKAGQLIVMKISTTNQYRDDGTLVTIIGYAVDVTEERKSEVIRRRYQLFSEHASDIFLFMGSDGRIMEANTAAVKAYGYERDELLSLYARDIAVDPTFPTDGELIYGKLQSACESGLTYESLHRRKDGSVFPVEVNAQSAVVDGRSILMSVVRDISERKETEKAVTAHKQAELDILRQSARAEALTTTAESLNSQLDLESVLAMVCEKTQQALGLPAFLRLYEHKRKALIPVAGSNGIPPGFIENLPDIVPSTFDEITKHTHSGIRTIVDLDFIRQEPYSRFDVQSICHATMTRNDHLIGTLTVVSFGEEHPLSHGDQELLNGLAHQAAQAIANAELFEEANRRLGFLQALRDVDKAITGSIDLETTLQIFLNQVTSQLGVHAADVLVLEKHSNALVFAAGHGFRSRALQRTYLRMGHGHAGCAAEARKIVHVEDLREAKDGVAASKLLPSEEFVCYWAVPLIAKGQVEGVLEVFHREPLDPDDEWLGFLEALAGQAAIAIDNASLFQALETANRDLVVAYDTTLEGWSRALDLRDKETEGHSLRVTETTVHLARKMGISGEALVHIRRGALLHDIGKMGIPDSILMKPGALTEKEWVVMRKHPIYALDLLSNVPFLRAALDIPYCHHERWDGTGYPRGLSEERIPLAARIFAVVDVWDALSSDRSYRKAWTRDKVIEFLREQSGIQFDPSVVDTFLLMIKEG